MKLYWKMYLLLAGTTLAALILTIWVSFSVLPGFFERQRNRTLDQFEERILSGSMMSREEVAALADSMNIAVRLVHEGNQPPPLQNQHQLPHAPPGEGDMRNVRLITLPGSQISLLASPRMSAPRFTLFLLFALVLFASQAAALALGLKTVFRRTALLTKATGEFGRGQLTSRYPDHGSNDEIDEMGNAFNVMAERIISLLDSHNELLNAVAHELRTPLARLSFALELARDNPQTVKEKLGLMEKDLFELDTLVSELLEFNRIGNTEPGRVRVSLDDVCHEAADAERVHSRSVSIHVTPGGEDSVVRGDHRLLLRAVSNLVRNSVRYASSSVFLKVAAGNDEVSVTVSDDGQGFPKGFSERAVRPFVKGENSEGSGLGLSIVQRIAEKHGGSLVLRNTGTGAQAELSIPK